MEAFDDPKYNVETTEDHTVRIQLKKDEMKKELLFQKDFYRQFVWHNAIAVETIENAKCLVDSEGKIGK
ncbi:MAG: hypothetical protein EOP45_08000 [Sphingobacteriaceae bacterium]|nr:MAG: hypothetical protein EOP45_08000 [Sphingobacteriaceae bacterium]